MVQVFFFLSSRQIIIMFVCYLLLSRILNTLNTVTKCHDVSILFQRYFVVLSMMVGYFRCSISLSKVRSFGYGFFSTIICAHHVWHDEIAYTKRQQFQFQFRSLFVYTEHSHQFYHIPFSDGSLFTGSIQSRVDVCVFIWACDFFFTLSFQMTLKYNWKHGHIKPTTINDQRGKKK